MLLPVCVRQQLQPSEMLLIKFAPKSISGLKQGSQKPCLQSELHKVQFFRVQLEKEFFITLYLTFSSHFNQSLSPVCVWVWVCPHPHTYTHRVFFHTGESPDGSCFGNRPSAISDSLEGLLACDFSMASISQILDRSIKHPGKPALKLAQYLTVGFLACGSIWFFIIPGHFLFTGL